MWSFHRNLTEEGRSALDVGSTLPWDGVPAEQQEKTRHTYTLALLWSLHLQGVPVTYSFCNFFPAMTDWTLSNCGPNNPSSLMWLCVKYCVLVMGEATNPPPFLINTQFGHTFPGGLPNRTICGLSLIFPKAWSWVSASGTDLQPGLTCLLKFFPVLVLRFYYFTRWVQETFVRHFLWKCFISNLR